jgi:hypothetical protein
MKVKGIVKNFTVITYGVCVFFFVEGRGYGVGVSF